MKKLIILFTLLFYSPLFAAPAFKADGYANAFNDEARAVKIDTRFALEKCIDNDRDSCTFGAGPHIKAMVVKRAPGLTAVLIWDGDQDAFGDWIAAMGLTMAVFSPAVDKDQRAVAFKTIMSRFKGKKKHGEAILDGQKYVLQVVQGIGLWFSVDPAE